MPTDKNSEHSLDLRGMSCPMNFVHIKIALDALAPGTVLTVLLDGSPTARDVVSSLETQGYEVLSLEENKGEATLRVRKKI